MAKKGAAGADWPPKAIGTGIGFVFNALFCVGACLIALVILAILATLVALVS